MEDVRFYLEDENSQVVADQTVRGIALDFELAFRISTKEGFTAYEIWSVPIIAIEIVEHKIRLALGDSATFF